MPDLTIKSPLTGSTNILIEEELDSKTIISLYLKNYNVDVSNYFKEVESVKICRCLDTNYRFYYPLNLAGGNELYRELQKSYGYYLSGKWEHQVAIDLISADCLVLEVGCGTGKFIEILQKKGINCIGLELNEDAVNEAKNSGLCVQNQTIEEHAQLNADKYDVVCLFQVLEHIVEVESFLRSCISVLKPGGKLIIGVPNNNPYLLKHEKYFTLNLPPHHMGLWNAKSLASLSKIFNIRLERLIFESLEPWYYENYFGFYIQKLKSKSVPLGIAIQFFFQATRFFLLHIRPYRVGRRLQKLVGSFFEGHSVLSVFTK